MITALLLAAVLQAPTVDDHIAAFLKGDDKARGELVKLGAAAIRPLQKAREKDPSLVDALVLDLKKGAMIPADSPMARDLEKKVTLKASTVTLTDDPEARKVEWDDVRRVLPCPVFVMPFGRADVKAMTATIKVTDRPAREVLEQLFDQTGLDFAYVHNAVVVGPADRLWSAGFRPAFVATQTLDPVDAAHLKVLESRTTENLLMVDSTGEALAQRLLPGREMEYEIRSDAMRKNLVPIVDTWNFRYVDVLALVAQMSGCDVAISAGKVVFDSREGLEKAFPKK